MESKTASRRFATSSVRKVNLTKSKIRHLVPEELTGFVILSNSDSFFLRVLKHA